MKIKNISGMLLKRAMPGLLMLAGMAQGALAANAAPQVAITLPSASLSATAPTGGLLKVSASDSDGTIAKVEFYQGSTLLGTATAAPYSQSFVLPAAGTYAFTAKAYDNLGAVSTTPALTVTSSALPAQWTKIASEGETVTVTGTRTVRFGSGNSWLQKSVTGSLACNLITFGGDPLPGIDKQCNVANQAPVASITLPTASPLTATTPSGGLLKVDASDTDGTVTKVEFYQGSTLLGTATVAPYKQSFTMPTAGTYVFTAKAYDNLGAVTTTSAVTVTGSALPAQWTRLAYEGETVAISGTQTVRFGSGNTWVQKAVTGSLACNITTFGDPLPGIDKQCNVAAGNKAPTVSLTAPAAGASYTAPASVTITATAADTDGTVSKVEFYNGSTLLGTSTAAPYSFTWTNVAAGTYSITAKATDNQSAATTSAAVSLTVAAANKLPTVAIVYPTSSLAATMPSAVFLIVDASDSDGSIAKVEIYRNTELVSTLTAAPYKTSISLPVVTNYIFTAKAYDNKGAVTASSTLSVVGSALPAQWTKVATEGETVSIAGTQTVRFGSGNAWLQKSVTGTLACTAANFGSDPLPGIEKQCNVAAGNKAPTVSLTAPAAGASFTAPASVAITATAADTDGTVSKVEFYNGSTLLGTSTAAPYSFTWTNVAAGTYSITAKATDNQSAATTSAAVSVTVAAAANKAPTVSLTAPAAGASFTAPASVTITATAADSDGTVSKVEFYNGTTLLGTSTAAPYSFTWTNVAAGTYSITAKATDNRSAATTSTAVSVTVAATANKAPTVSLTAPAAGASFTAPASVAITATAADTDGTVSKVEFYNGTTLLGTSTAAPYSFTWTNVAAGTYSITAKATDNQSAATTSAAVSVTVAAAANKAPTVSLTAPAAGASFTAPASVAITATAADTDGTVSKVEFYNGTTLLGTSTAAPYSFTWTNVAAGTYSITAKATDNRSAATTSAAVSVTVAAAANKAPTVSLTAPAAGASFTAPASVAITATAADTDGTVSKVEFYNGTTLLGTSTAAPYSFTWANVAAGSYSITAKATDNQSAATTSAAVSVTVSAVQAAATTLYYVHPDHLGTPRLISNQAGTTVWRWDNQESFGLTGLQEDPDADTKKLNFNLRFAGQYYDQESGLFYNRNRHYDPATGRYVQADPTGLSDGVSLYGYVSGNPLSFIDPLGLAKCPAVERGANGEPLRARTSVGPEDLGGGTGTNASSRAYAQSMGNTGDDAGHILGRNLGGSGGKDNIFAQAPNINRGEFAQFEKQLAKNVQKNGSVDVDVQFSYGNSGTRPTAVTYDVYRDGQKVLSRIFGN